MSQLLVTVDYIREYRGRWMSVVGYDGGQQMCDIQLCSMYQFEAARPEDVICVRSA